MERVSSINTCAASVWEVVFGFEDAMIVSLHPLDVSARRKVSGTVEIRTVTIEVNDLSIQICNLVIDIQNFIDEITDLKLRLLTSIMRSKILWFRLEISSLRSRTSR
jgi:hypothetical protein